jgi:hypothetical protein
MAQRISAKEFKGMVVMIRHTVAFTLKHDAGSSAERDFLEAADVLADIPGVLRFEKLRQFFDGVCRSGCIHRLQRTPVARRFCK